VQPNVTASRGNQDAAHLLTNSKDKRKKKSLYLMGFVTSYFSKYTPHSTKKNRNTTAGLFGFFFLNSEIFSVKS